MLLYPNDYCGFPLLFIVNGSVVPRAIVPALLSFGFTHLLQAVVPNFHEYFVSLMVNQYAFGVFSAHVAFLLVFRVNTSYHRYWEGCSHVMTFTTKWGDAVTEAFVHSLDFDRFSESEEKKDSALFRAQLAHLASLMHAVAVAFLRGQTDVGCFETAPEPAKGTNHLKANSAAEAPTYCSVGTWLNAMLRFDSTAKGYQQFLTKYPLNVLGGVSKAEVEELKSLEAVERVHLLHVKILAILTARKANQGFVHVFPPEFARMGAYLSEGNVNFRQAAKLRNCPIPFPYQQLTTICLLLFALLFPIVAVASASGDVTESNLWFAPISTLLSTFLFFAMNEVAREMEDPFMHPPNGYPLVLQQNLFNNRMRVNVASLTERTLGLTNSANGTLGLSKEQVDQSEPAQLLKQSWKKYDANLTSTEYAAHYDPLAPEYLRAQENDTDRKSTGGSALLTRPPRTSRFYSRGPRTSRRIGRDAIQKRIDQSKLVHVP